MGARRDDSHHHGGRRRRPKVDLDGELTARSGADRLTLRGADDRLVVLAPNLSSLRAGAKLVRSVRGPRKRLPRPIGARIFVKLGPLPELPTFRRI